MSELKLYEVSEEYISYISTVEKNVFSSKVNDRNHTRKQQLILPRLLPVPNKHGYYIGIPLETTMSL